jgi:antitoxin component YwqK of YwqJK toxin-antitoxin module
MTETTRVRLDDLTTSYTEGGSPVILYQGRPFEGIAVEYDGEQIISETSYADGTQKGPSRTWYPSGQLESESEFRSNRLHGRRREWREDGTLESETEMELGCIVRRTSFDEAGRLSTVYRVEDDPEGLSRLERQRAIFQHHGLL